MSENPRSAAISVIGLSKRYGKQRVLEDVSLDVPSGEVLVVLGPSGSGKTTLLRIIAGLEPPNSGEIFLNGRPAVNLPPQARNLGVVFQEQALFQRMTVEENIAYGLKLRRTPEKGVRRVLGEMLELIRLTDHRRKYPSQLSGGQRQRVAVARALAFRPEAMLFDEPFSALDAVTRAELRREVRSLLKMMGIPAFFITHDQEEALELGDRIAVINSGAVEQVDTPFEIYNHPRNEFVATFLGAANVLVGRWREGYVRIGEVRIKAAPGAAAGYRERQPVKVVFRPEDAVLGFQRQLLDTPFYLGSGVIDDVSYTGPVERLVVRLHLRPQHGPGTAGVSSPKISRADEAYPEGFPVTVTRTKWEASEMSLTPGDPVVVGLKDYRLLAHYPLGTEGGAKRM
jgi:ABC-type Fe3+/spermidine/putrescine transport system ATPase subunit